MKLFSELTRKQRKTLLRILLAGVLWGLLWLMPERGPGATLLFLASYLLIGYDILWEALLGLKNRQPFDECFLMALSTVGAMALGNLREAVAVMLFYQIGELFQSIAVGKSRRNIAALMDIRPDSANLLGENGEITVVEPEEVPAGSRILVRPGERIPLDGVVVKGCSALDTAALTGESLPREVAEGSAVPGGCINLTGVLELTTTKEYDRSTVARVLALVEDAASRKSPSEDFISKFARIYTPAVCFAALGLALLPPLVSLLAGGEAAFRVWIYRALTFLVISCPCALVVSIPLSFFAGIGRAGAAGILIKGSNFMETLSEVRLVAFDKTGTLTEGKFSVTELHPVAVSEETLLSYAALAESFSSHPVGQGILAAYGKETDRSRLRDLREHGGRGITAMVEGKLLAVGSDRLMQELALPLPAAVGSTAVHVALGGEYLGYLLLRDTAKAGARGAVQALRRTGIRKTVMLTGDSIPAAEAVGKALGVDEVYGQLLPEDKVAKVEALLSSLDRREKLAFVGDGINDAPVLSRADIGIAMGALGSDAAIEAADVVLMDDDPRKLVAAIRISRKCLRIVRENIVFALGVKGACLLLGALGLAGMGGAIFADVGVMVLAVLNAVRALNRE